MAAQTPKFSSHSRSISLPASSHPLITTVEEHLQRLRSSGDASSSHASTCKKLDGLKNLYDVLDDALHMSNNKNCDEAVDGSLRILDICGEVREIYSQMKQNVQQLESSLRRKRSGDFSNEVSAYTNSTKPLNKMISKCFKELKKTEKIATFAEQENHLFNLIQEVQQISVSILEATLSYISSNKKGVSLVSKFMKSTKKSDISTIEKIEALLNNKNSDIRSAVKQLESINSSIQESEELLETVFRQLVKSRVSLLNILNH